MRVTEISVNSMAIEKMNYNEASKLLVVTFQSGKEYVYYNVPKRVFVKAFSVDSIGAYFNKAIKPKYDFELIG
jgi:hypothetical protein